ncbi:MAG: glucose-1-phosphate adenylyltransferase [Planctomycetota bacterium]
MRFRVLALVMAGGKGERLHPLTAHRAKPAVPFGGKFRIIDFALSNLVNSGVRSIYVLTQFKCQSLLEHLQLVWSSPPLHGDNFIVPLPAQMRVGESWYRGTADSIFQNLERIEEHHPDVVAVFAGDHIYKMDIAQMIASHREREAAATVAVLPFPRSQASQFGIVEVNDRWEVVAFREKPADPKPMPGRPDMSLVSMGNYLFNRGVLTQELAADAPQSTHHDFGRDILPKMLGRVRLYAYDFTQNNIPGTPPGTPNTYWRDIGTLDAFYEANMDLRAAVPSLNLYTDDWPIRAETTYSAPAKLIHDEAGTPGTAIDSLLCEGTIISGAHVENSVFSPNVRIESGAEVFDSILMEGVVVGRGAKVRRAIIDKFVKVEAGMRIGYDLEQDREHYTVTASGVVVIPKWFRTRQVTEFSL